MYPSLGHAKLLGQSLPGLDVRVGLHPELFLQDIQVCLAEHGAGTAPVTARRAGQQPVLGGGGHGRHTDVCNKHGT